FPYTTLFRSPQASRCLKTSILPVSLLEIESSLCGCLLDKTQLQPERVLFCQLLPAGRSVLGRSASGVSRPLSSRSARVHRAANSRLCVTRIDLPAGSN